MDLVHIDSSDEPSELGVSHGSNYQTLKIDQDIHKLHEYEFSKKRRGEKERSRRTRKWCESAQCMPGMVRSTEAGAHSFRKWKKSSLRSDCKQS